MSPDPVAALRFSVERLQRIVEPLDDDALAAGAYPTEWTIAEVLSHIGSGAVIMLRRLEDGLTGGPTPEEFAPAVWDAWNAKTPRAQADDALAADAALLTRLDALTPGERASFVGSMGPMTFDFPTFVGLRVNEHAFHTWDIEVATKPDAVLPDQVAALVVDNLDIIARYTARPTGETTTVTVRTTAPERTFTLDYSVDSVTLIAGGAEDADVTLPAEAFARLVYGRLDPGHTPAVDADAGTLDVLRATFPGP